MLIVDTREQKNQFIIRYLRKHHIEFKKEKLDVGDYAFEDNPKFVIDRKANIQELVYNVTHEHDRILREMERAKTNGVRLLFLVEDENVHSLDDLNDWNNPRRKWSPKATTGETLRKILFTMIGEYDMQVLFVNRKYYASTLIRLLEVNRR